MGAGEYRCVHGEPLSQSDDRMRGDILDAVARGDLRIVRPAPSLDELPEVLTVEEAAAVLRIGRGNAYELARLWRESGGRQGLPVVTLGRSLRVPRDALRRLLEVAGPTAAEQ